MKRHYDLIVIALDPDDFFDWLEECDELSTADVLGVVCDDWDGVSPSRVGAYASTYVLTERATQHPALGGTEKPRWLRAAVALAERERPAYLKAVAA